MVKLFFVGIFYKKENNTVVCQKYAEDLSSFGFFQRKGASEFMMFTSKMVVERSELATRSSIKQQEYLCHVYIQANRLAGVLISDHEYPHRVAHTLLSKICNEYSDAIAESRWPTFEDNRAPFTGLDLYLARYQNPNEADAMTKIQNDLDETKIILHNTITSILERGENLDNLVAKSEDISTQSKMFYKTARKTNQCCQLY